MLVNRLAFNALLHAHTQLIHYPNPSAGRDHEADDGRCYDQLPGTAEGLRKLVQRLTTEFVLLRETHYRIEGVNDQSSRSRVEEKTTDIQYVGELVDAAEELLQPATCLCRGHEVR